MLSMNTVIVIIIYYQPSICQATKCIFVKAFFRREAARNALFQGGNASPDLERAAPPGVFVSRKVFLMPGVTPQLRTGKGCHCERSEAISAFKYRDCFVVSLLATTEVRHFPRVTE